VYEVELTARLSISFQRYPYPLSGFVTDLPTSHGALPFVVDATGQVLLPSPDREAFWVGFIPELIGTAETVQLLATLASGEILNAASGAPPRAQARPPEEPSFTAPPARGVAGIRRGAGSWWAFAREAGTSSRGCRGLTLSTTTGEHLRVTLLPPDVFEARTDLRVPQLDRRSRYRGRRLP
jgi:hypothetical protein